MDQHVSLSQLKLFLIYTVFHRTRHISSLFGLYHKLSSINEMIWPYHMHCFLSCLFLTYAVNYGFIDLFLVVFRDGFLHHSPNSMANIGIFNVVSWCAIPLHLPALLSQLFCTCCQLVEFLTFCICHLLK